MSSYYNEIRIEDLSFKNQIEDSNLIIVEDSVDTKKSTVLELKRAIIDDKETVNNKTYSSSKIKSLMENMSIDLNSKASSTRLESVEKRLSQILATNPAEGKDLELVDARDGYDTLNERLSSDKKEYYTEFIKRYYKQISGNPITLDNNKDKINLSAPTITTDAIISYKSKNLFNIRSNTSNAYIDITDTGFIYKQKRVTVTDPDGNVVNTIIKFTVDLNLGTILNSGVYRLYGNSILEAGFNADNIKFRISYTDGTTEDIDYPINDLFVFDAAKRFNKITFVLNELDFIEDSVWEMKNMMISTYLDLEYYRDINVGKINISPKQTIVDFQNNDYVFTLSDAVSNIVISFYDNTVTMNTLYDKSVELEELFNSKIEKCGLIEEYGIYHLFEEVINDRRDDSTITYDIKKVRNGIPSVRMDIDKEASKNPIFYKAITHDKGIVVDNVSILFYIDRDISNEFTDHNGINIILSCDAPGEDPANFFKYSIGRNEIHQGWNFVKRSLGEFEVNGIPLSNNINNIVIEVYRTNNINGRTIWFNSVVFNQRMKPVVLLAFDGIYEEGLDYTYPLLKVNNIPATIFANGRSTLSTNVLDKVSNYFRLNGWDIGGYSCHPDKEILNEMDNARDQYIGLRSTLEWLQENLTYNPISYSGALGMIQPITVPILRDLGFKIAKANSESYCSFFNENDFIIPMHRIDNTTTSEILIDKINYAINTGQAVCLYTNSVTEFGEENAANKTMFENVLNHIIEQVELGNIECMTFREFYEKCTK